MSDSNADHEQPAPSPGHVDVRSMLVPGQIPVDALDHVALQLSVIGRTEDVAVSPDGRRIAARRVRCECARHR